MSCFLPQVNKISSRRFGIIEPRQIQLENKRIVGMMGRRSGTVITEYGLRVAASVSHQLSELLMKQSGQASVQCWWRFRTPAYLSSTKGYNSITQIAVHKTLLTHIRRWYNILATSTHISFGLQIISEMAQMRAVLVKDGAGGSDSLFIGETEKPTPAAGEVLVKVSWFGSSCHCHWRTRLLLMRSLRSIGLDSSWFILLTYYLIRLYSAYDWSSAFRRLRHSVLIAWTSAKGRGDTLFNRVLRPSSA